MRQPLVAVNWSSHTRHTRAMPVLKGGWGARKGGGRPMRQVLGHDKGSRTPKTARHHRNRGDRDGARRRLFQGAGLTLWCLREGGPGLDERWPATVGRSNREGFAFLGTANPRPRKLLERRRLPVVRRNMGVCEWSVHYTHGRASFVWSSNAKPALIPSHTRISD